MTKQAIREGFEQLRPGEQLRAARGGRPLALRGRLARRHERDPRRHDPRPRLGRRRRLARPRPDADAGADRQARARDPGVRPRAVLARPRHVRGAEPRGYEGLWFEGDETRICKDGDARRRDRRRRSPARTATVENGRAQGADRARAAPLRPDARSSATRTAASASRRAARCRPRSRSTRTRRRSPTRARAPATSRATWSPSSSRPPRRSRRSPSTRRRRATCSARAAAARPRRQRREGRRPPRDHPDRRRARPRDVLATTSAASSTWSPSRFLAVFHPPARYARTTVVTRGRGASASARAARSRSRPAGAASTASRPTSRGAQDEDDAEGGELPRLEQGKTIRCVEAVESRPRRRGRRRATPRRRCSRRWRRPAS